MWKSFFKEKVIPFLRLIGKPVAFFIDIVLIPITFVSGYFLFFYRWVGSKRFPLNTKLLKKIGIFPIRDNFYEPLFNDIHLKDSFKHKRILSSIDFKLTNQNGEKITQEFYNDKIYVADFFFTTCQDICPIMTKNMYRLQEELKDRQLPFMKTLFQKIRLLCI